MQRTSMLTAAIAVAVMTSGIAMMPVQAVEADCDHDFNIPSTPPLLPRPLGTTGNDVGRIVVDDSGDAVVTVRLETEADKMDFGVFYSLDTAICGDAWAADLSTCKTHESLDTSNEFPVDRNCTLDAAPTNKEITYYFVHVNNGTTSLDYRTFGS